MSPILGAVWEAWPPNDHRRNNSPDHDWTGHIFAGIQLACQSATTSTVDDRILRTIRQELTKCAARGSLLDVRKLQ
jgi:hypothetical protein